MSIKAHVIPRYRRARELAGLSLEHAAKLLDWPKWMLKNYESGRSAPPSVCVRLLSDVYGCSVEWLLGSDPVIPDGTRTRGHA